MSLYTALALAAVVAAGLFAWRYGGPPEWTGAAVIFCWAILDVLYHLSFGPSDSDVVDPVHVVLDGLKFVAFAWIALRANRMWPMWAAAAQLVCVMGHVAALIETGGMPRAYWAAMQIPPWLQIVALLAGTAAHARRTQQIGRYRSWRRS